MKEQSKDPQHLEPDGDLASIVEDEIDIPSTTPIDDDLPDPGKSEGSLSTTADEARKAEVLKVWKRRHPNGGET